MGLELSHAPRRAVGLEHEVRAAQRAVHVIGGTPTTAGTYRFTVQVTDGVGDTARQRFSIAVG